jgi:hypothetical protein
MSLLILEDDRTITGEDSILTEVTRNYTTQFTEPTLSQKGRQMQREARDHLLRHTTIKITAAESRFLEEPPTLLELGEIVKLLHNDKSPGADGLTAKVFKACWHFIQHNFLQMVLAYWATGELAYTIKEGIIKLLPKKTNKRRLRDWRPLTMLTVVYKIIAKLLALRLNLLLPQLVSPKQTGFIPGWHILENISLAWLTHDWVKARGHPALFLSLDFEKAFNRVNHDYIWETMAKLGFGKHFILLVQGLLTNGTS